ncbi:MAG: hypothetical protein ABIZ81_09445 [Opitutaceae bacterium]
MTTPEKVELSLIPVAVAVVGIGARFLPERLGVGKVLTISCLAWLVQGGLRDLWFLYRLRSRPAMRSGPKVACMCLESSLGLSGVLVGVVLALFGSGGSMELSQKGWMLLTTGVLVLGFLAKDFVVSWRPWGIRREREHHSFVFTWRE